MVIIYVGLCLLMIILNIRKIPSAVMGIFQGVFGLRAVSGGALGAMIISMQKGVFRGIFSNEAGLGTDPIAVVAAKTKDPVRQGLVSMIGAFVATLVICNMTGIALVLAGAWNTGLDGTAATIFAFSRLLPISEKASSFIVLSCLSCFAFTTILGWNYYCERCLSYLTKGYKKGMIAFKILYIFALFIGPYLTVTAVWTIADIFNGLMALPNIIASILLSPIVFKETKNYFSTLCKKI